MEIDKKMLKWEKVFFIALALSFAVLVGYLSYRDFTRWISMRRMKTCQKNIEAIVDAKARWTLDHGKKYEDVPTLADLVGPGKYLKEMPRCPSGFDYKLNESVASPECMSDLPGHARSEIAWGPPPEDPP